MASALSSRSCPTTVLAWWSSPTWTGLYLRDLVPYYVYDRLLGLDSIDWVQRFLEIEHKARDQELAAEKKGYTGQKPGTHPSHEIPEYEGEFEHPGYGKVSIRLNTKTNPAGLVVKLNDVERPLEHFHYDSLQVPANPLDPFEKLPHHVPDRPAGRTLHADGDARSEFQRDRLHARGRAADVPDLVPSAIRGRL